MSYSLFSIATPTSPFFGTLTARPVKGGEAFERPWPRRRDRGMGVRQGVRQAPDRRDRCRRQRSEHPAGRRRVARDHRRDAGLRPAAGDAQRDRREGESVLGRQPVHVGRRGIHVGARAAGHRWTQVRLRSGRDIPFRRYATSDSLRQIRMRSPAAFDTGGVTSVARKATLILRQHH